MIGAGFPFLFICDDWGGGSPTSSWGKIDFADVLNGGLHTQGFLLDVLVYFTLFFAAGLLLTAIQSKIARRRGSTTKTGRL
jgi:hypothetical protein